MYADIVAATASMSNQFEVILDDDRVQYAEIKPSVENCDQRMASKLK